MGTPKCNFFAWLILQNKVWMADRLTRRGWPNCGLCHLCKREPETAMHLMFKCRYSLRIWHGIQGWLGLLDFDITQWSSYASVKDWWCSISGTNGRRLRDLSSLLLLAAWEIWNERNARFSAMWPPCPFRLSILLREMSHFGVRWGKAFV